MTKRLLIAFSALAFTLFPILQAGTYESFEYEVLGDEIIITAATTDLAKMMIPSSIEGLPVTIIGERAFSTQTNLTSVTFPTSLRTIDPSAFEGCSNLATLNFGDMQSVRMGRYAFKDCTSLTHIEIPDSAILGAVNQAFDGCTGLVSVSFGKEAGWSGSLNDMFAGCPNFASIEVHPEHPYYTTIEGVLYDKAVKRLIFAPQGFEGVYNVPDTLESLEPGLLSDCSKMTEINVGEANINYTSLDGVLYDKSATILMKAPSGMSGELNVPDGIRIISSQGSNGSAFSNEAFAGCENLTRIFIPSSVTNIGVQIGSRAGEHFGQSFQGCSKLQRIDVDESNAAYASVDGVLFSKNLSLLLQLPVGYAGAFTIPDTTTSIQFSAFWECENLTSITLGSGVSRLLVGAFAPINPFIGCFNLQAIEIAETNENYTSLDGVLFDKTMQNLLFFPAGKSSSYIIPDGVTTIGDYAFSACPNLERIEIPESVTKIDDFAFSRCTNLNNIVIPDSVTFLGSSVFSECTSLTSIDFGNTISAIPSNTFYFCTSLESMILPENITSIGDKAFAECHNLTSITFPSSLTKIGDGAFINCRKLTRIDIPNSVIEIGNNAFSFCTGITDLSLGKGANALGDEYFPSTYVFLGCYRLQSVTIPETFATVGIGTFVSCLSLKSIFFLGEAPTSAYFLFDDTSPNLVVYYLSGTPGWNDTLSDVPTAPFLPSWGTFTPAPNPDGIFVDTDSWLGWLDITKSPWAWSYKANAWLFIPESVASLQTGWIFIPELALESPGLWLYMEAGTDYGWSYSLEKWLYTRPEAVQSGSGWAYLL